MEGENTRQQWAEQREVRPDEGGRPDVDPGQWDTTERGRHQGNHC